MNGAAVSFELSNGTFSATIAGLAAISATSVLVQYTSATGAVTSGTTLTVGTFTYAFSGAIAANTVAVAVTGLNATFSDFVTLTGNVGFKKNGT